MPSEQRKKNRAPEIFMLTQNSIERVRLQLTNVLVRTVAAKIAPSPSKGTLALWTMFNFYFLGSSHSLIHFSHLWSQISYDKLMA